MALQRRRNRQHEHGGTPSTSKEPRESEELLLLSSAGKNPGDAVAAEPTATDGPRPAPQAFHVAKFALLRLLGVVYLCSFAGAWRQNRGLMGAGGLVPARDHVDRLRGNYASSAALRGFAAHPSLHWFVGPSLEDWHLDAAAAAGATLSLAVVAGLDSWLAMACLWLLHFSIVTVAEGTSFYAYGWESQLLETGFLSIWLCDLPSLRAEDGVWGLLHDATPPSPPSLPVLWLFRWLCVRISVGAGLIKLRGGECWKNKTCLYYHFETQPIPSPLSFFFHFLPKRVLRRAVDLDFFVQLYAIWMVLMPGFNSSMTNVRRIGGCIQVRHIFHILASFPSYPTFSIRSFSFVRPGSW